MFAKVFAQIFDSTIAENYQVRHIFMDLLVMADSDGVVDKTPQAIARISNVPLDQVEIALAALAAPDPHSRTQEQEGKRIELMDSKRSWGWRIVNYAKYREIRDEEARRVANRSYKRDQRRRDKESARGQHLSAKCPDSQTRQALSAKGEGEAEAEAEEPKNTKRGGGLQRQYRKKAPPSTFSQTDFDERDLRNIGKVKIRLQGQIANGLALTNEQYYGVIAEESGLTVKRILDLEKLQKAWP